MKFRTWPYGTVKHATVIAVMTASTTALVVRTDEDPGEAFMLVMAPRSDVVKGQRGIMTFRKGGPYGGYWDYEPDTANTTIAGDAGGVQ